jgi:murein tripeptide amidase MpaA
MPPVPAVRSVLVPALLLAAAACAPGAAPGPAADAAPGPRTRAERSGYTETSTHADVVGFLDALGAEGLPLRVEALGRTTEGRDLPLVVASRPLPASPEAARRSGKPIVYLQGNIHAGEVEGKEALQALLRDLLRDPRPNALDSVVVLMVPIYNADGNERFGPQAENRSEQNGPERVGVRANAQGLDLNRDYVKAEAPETRASLAAFAAWDPDVFVDLHTTDGSYHGYALTYAPSLTPAAGEAGAAARDAWLPELRRRMRARHGRETFDYGNFSQRYGADVNTDTVREGWFSYDHRPRFGTNYVGLRGRISLLGEAFSHDPFERRVQATREFVREILSLAAERSAELRARRAALPRPGDEVALRAELTRSPYVGDVLTEDLAPADPSLPREPGVHPGVRRTGRFRTLRIPVHDRFDATLRRTLPHAWLLGPEQAAAVAALRLHGVRVDSVAAPAEVALEVFTVDSATFAARPFQGHREAVVHGRWTRVRRTVRGGWTVPAGQPLGVVAAYLLEPESDDGLATWNAFDAALAPGREFPVARVVEAAR